MICKRCNASNSDNARFCRNCGAKLRNGRSFTPFICVLLLVLVVLIVFVVIENQKNEHDDDRAHSMIDTPVTECLDEDSVTVENEDAVTEELCIETKVLNKHFGDSFMEIEFPVSGSPVLLQNIYEWMNESFGGSYQGGQNDFQSMVEYYYERQRDAMESNEYCKIKIKKIYENSVVISFLKESEIYAGGVHSLESTQGATFRKMDGKLFSINFINDFSGLRPSIVLGLKGNFNVGSDDELLERLLNIQTIEEIPRPTENPWITEKGVTFLYEPYEIACYAEGSPFCVVPIQKVAHCVSSTAKTFFE